MTTAVVVAGIGVSCPLGCMCAFTAVGTIVDIAAGGVILVALIIANAVGGILRTCQPTPVTTFLHGRWALVTTTWRMAADRRALCLTCRLDWLVLLHADAAVGDLSVSHSLCSR